MYRFVVLLCSVLGLFAMTAAMNMFPACSSNVINILTTNFVFSPGEAQASACPLNDDALNSSAQAAVWVLMSNNGHCNFSGPVNVSACVNQNGSLVINNTIALCSASAPAVILCFSALSTTSIAVDCRHPGFYLSNGSNFSATAGSTFSTIPAWISYGLIQTSLQLLQLINGSYVPADAFAVDYARLGRCLTANPEPHSPLQVTIRLAGSEPAIAESLVGRHIFVVVGNSSSARYMSPPILLDVQNAASVPPTAPNGDLSAGAIVGIAVAVVCFIGIILLILIITVGILHKNDKIVEIKLENMIQIPEVSQNSKNA